MTALLLATVPCVGQGSAAAPGAPQVRAGGTLLRGTWSEDEPSVAVFRGIPFAAPPVGGLRWRAPAPAVPTPGVRDARHFAPACMQDSGGVDWYADIARAFGHGPDVVEGPLGVSEDCLYLNIWTPGPGVGEKLPVMVFVHGGGNSAGWSYEPNYRGSRLAARGAVVVSVAYRLGPFGFFAHPALGDGRAEPVANFGLLDIRRAFEWLHDHVAAFGGDPELLTAFGESAGALNLVDLLLADVARRRAEHSLFRRLIVQSIGGSLVERQDLREEQNYGRRLVAALGLGADATAEDLRDIPAADLLSAVSRMSQEVYPAGVVDGRVLPARPLEIIEVGRFAGVELLIGTNAQEWLMYIDADADERQLREWVGKNAPGQEAQLRAALGEEAPRINPRIKMDRLETAREMLCPSRFLARRVNDTGGSAWVYHFSRQREGQEDLASGRALGAYHGAELPYVFDTHDSWLPTVDVDRRLTAEVAGYWLEFAKRGRPAPDDGVWPPFTTELPVTMELGDPGGIVPPFDEPLCELLGPGG